MQSESAIVSKYARPAPVCALPTRRQMSNTTHPSFLTISTIAVHTFPEPLLESE